MKNFLIFFTFSIILTFTNVEANQDFKLWLIDFKKTAVKEGISKNTVDEVMNNARFLSKVIEYDRFQPEFYEDTKTYVKKRTGKEKIKKGLILYKEEKEIINTIEKKFSVEKELLLALMGIETNFGKYLGKMDIISSLSTLSFDKRRSEFFTNELLTLLRLIDKNIIDKNILFGSWAGAFGNFQFMPSTIKNYAVDHDKDGKINLKQTDDSFASAANYLNNLGWDNTKPCFYRINLRKNVPQKYLNVSAKKIHSMKKVEYLKKYILDNEFLSKHNNLSAAIVTPDSEIVENSDKLSPSYIIFNNYNLILKWNRSLRFALAVCTLKDKFTNEL